MPLELVGTVDTAKLTITNLANGSHSIIATYSGSQTFNASAQHGVHGDGWQGRHDVYAHRHADQPDHDKTPVTATVKPAVANPCAPTGTGTVGHRRRAQPNQALALPLHITSTTGQDTIYPIFADGSHTVIVTYDGDATYAGCTATANFTTPDCR